jgi:GTPase SAR1 family protein
MLRYVCVSIEGIMIPPEIKKLGKEAKKIFLRALNEGKEQIPYCGLLILGEEGVGKTSLYRQLVGKEFDEHLKSTQGIDSNTVDTVDKRNISIGVEGVWHEIDLDAGDQFSDALCNSVVPELQDLQKSSGETQNVDTVPGKEELLRRVYQISMEVVEANNNIAVGLVGHTPISAPTPHPQPNDKEREEPSRLLDRRQSSTLDDYVTGKREFKKKRPSLLLNALDFAGQAYYRPMHHCFIVRRAVYVVVFKIPDMLNDESKITAINDVRYWIHSIHAHIYSPDKHTVEEDECINRVFLVGTHRGPQKLSGNEFKRIHEFIYKELVLRDTRCVNHICHVKLPDYGESCFIPVENSIDSNHDNYLLESGAKFFQDEIKMVYEDPDRLPFLHEVYPIKWLKFEENLRRLRKTRKPPIVKLEEIGSIAASDYQIDEVAMELAIRFLHETGKISCLSEFIN